jgi:hypothetical protein
MPPQHYAVAGTTDRFYGRLVLQYDRAAPAQPNNGELLFTISSTDTGRDSKFKN